MGHGGMKPRTLRRYEGRRVTVHLPGPSISGVLVGVYSDCLFLKHVVVHGEQQDTKREGEHCVPFPQPGAWVEIPDSVTPAPS